MRRYLFTTLVCLPSLLAMAGTQQSARPAVGSSQVQAARIGPDDTIAIQALGAEEISRSWRVNSSGDLNLPMIGRMSVAGMTVDQLEVAVTERLRRYVKAPQVSAYIAESRSRPVVVTGAVLQPGSFQLDGPATLFDMIVRAGGAKDPNGTVSLVRNKDKGAIPYPQAHVADDGQFEVADLSLKQVLDAHSREANLAIQPFDRITVAPPRQPQLVYIAGEVTRPGAVELVAQDVVSLMKLVAVGGGLTRTAAPSRAIVTHVNAAGVQTSIAKINLKKIMKGQAKDLELMPGDIVFIPSSGLTAFLQSSSISALTAGLYILARF